MKQIIVINRGLNMRRGKEIAQGAHAAVGAVVQAGSEALIKWQQSGTTKICLQVDSAEELIALQQKAKSFGLPTYLVRDAGRTEVEPGSITALAIGPAKISKIDAVTKDLKLY